MSNEIQNFREAVERFDSLLLDTDKISDKISKNYNFYNNLSSTTNDNITKQREIIQAISQLQNQIELLQDNYASAIKQQNKFIKDNKADNEVNIYKFNEDLEQLLNDTIKDIDLSKFDEEVKNLLDDKIKSLKDEINNLTKVNNDFNYVNKNISNKLLELNKQNDEIEILANSVNLKTILAIGFSAFFFGAIVVGGFGLHLLNNEFKEYINASKFEELAKEYNIQFVKEDNKKFIIIKKDLIEDIFLSTQNNKVIQLKNKD